MRILLPCLLALDLPRLLHCTDAAALVQAAGVLDPLLATLSGFNSPMHFKGQLAMLFDRLDVNATKTLDFENMADGLSELGFDPPILLSAEDWHAITRGGERACGKP